MESLNHPTSSFGGEPPPTAEPYMTVEELTEELLLQKVLLASLDDSDPDYENISSGIEKEIERLTTRLEVLNPKKKKKPTTTTASRTTSAQSGLSGSTASSLAISTPGSANSPYLSSSARQNTATDDRTNIPRVKMNDPFDDKPDFNMGGVMSSPFGRANSTPQANPALRIKRSHSDALGVLKEEHGRESKSRRTSPTDTPSEDKKKKPYNMDKNGFIDLVSDDEEDQSAIDRFVKGQRMLEKRAEREKRDRKMAEQLQRQSGNGSSSSNASKPPAPSAFARMMGVRSGSQAQNSQPASADTPATGPAAIVLGDSDDSELEVIPRSQFSPNDMRRNMTYPTSTPTGPPAVAAAYNPFATGASRVPYTAPSTGVAAASNPSRPTYAPYMPLNQRGIVKAEGGIFADPSLTIRHAGSPIFTGYATQSSQLPGSNPAAAIAGLPGAGFPRGPYDRANVADELGNAIMNGSSLYSRSLANDIMDFVNNPAKTEEQIRDLIENISPDMEMPKEDRQGTPEGMKYPLYEHQKIALTWMSKTECGSNKGGILADDMGLGKTISTLALMLSRTSPTRARKTTLIVAPVALLRQWDSEIHTKLKHGHKLSVFTYHSGKKASYEQLRNYDVVLTTYGTLGSEYKKCESFQARKLAHPSINLNSNEFQSKLPFLGEKSKWYRIVLDEAQNIKNKATKAAMGALHLKADFRWCLTGTPMMNGTHELFSLLRFLRIKPYNDQAAFNQAFGILTKGIGAKAGLERAMRRLQALLKSIMLRRSKNTVVDGKPIITLPEKTEEIVHAIFDEDQQNYYTSLESKSRAVFNKYHKAGTIGKNYSSILLLLLRLRQAACHPHLIMDLEEAPGQASTEFMVDMAKKLPESAVTRLKAATVPFECPVCYDPLTNPIFTLDCCHHACMECLAKITSEFDPNADNGEDRASNAKCPSCRKSISLSRIIDYTSFRIAHMGLVDPATKVEEDDSDSDTDSDDDSDDEASDDDDDANGNIRDFIVEDGVDDIETASSVDEDDDLDVKPRVEVKKKFKLEPLDSSDEDIEAPERPSRKAKVKREINEEDDMDVDDDDLDRKIKDDFEFKDDDYLPEPQEVLRRLAARGKHPLDKDEEEYSDSDVPIRQPRRKSKTALTRPSNKDNKKAAKKAVKPAEKKERREKGPKEDYKDPAKHLNLAQMKKDSRKNNEARRKYMRYLKKNFVTSAKIDKLMEILRATPEDTKTIVFSQFTTLLDLCEVPLREEDFGMGRYDGGMTAEHRYQAVEEFTRNPRQRVLLVSLKAGNAGLNLVAASQVIIIDPFWNPFVEMQAVDRAHRIGQLKPVTVHRILVQGTVEDRIIDLQNRKKKLVDAALDEKASAGISRLGQAELVYLFNNDDSGMRQTMVRPQPPVVRTPSAPVLPGMGVGMGSGAGVGAGGRAGMGGAGGMSNGYSLPPLQSIQSANGMGAGGGAGAGPNRSYQIFQPQQTLSFGAGSGSQLAPMNVYTPGSTMPQQERPTLPSFNHPSSSAGVHLPGSFPSSSNEDAEKKTFSSPAAARSGFEMPSSSASLRTGGLNMGDDLAERGTPRKFNSSFLD